MRDIPHLTKSVNYVCDYESEYVKGLYSSNIDVQRVVLAEFARYLKENKISEAEAIKRIKQAGGMTSKNTLWKLRSGSYRSPASTVLNMLARFCGYSNLLELGYVVYSRDGVSAASAG